MEQGEKESGKSLLRREKVVCFEKVLTDSRGNGDSTTPRQTGSGKRGRDWGSRERKGN